VIGPGWMPSRPRPLGRIRKSLVAYTRRPRPRRRRASPCAGRHMTADGTAPGCNTVGMLFDGLPAELPTATLLPGTRHDRHRVLGGHLRRWLDHRWAWLRPRTVPMIVAFAGMIAVLGTTRYLSTYACAIPRQGIMIYADNPAPHTLKIRAGSPGHIHIAPVRPGSRDVTITLEP
jgi:hypothetical protein